METSPTPAQNQGRTATPQKPPDTLESLRLAVEGHKATAREATQASLRAAGGLASVRDAVKLHTDSLVQKFDHLKAEKPDLTAAIEDLRGDVLGLKLAVGLVANPAVGPVG